MITDLKQKPDVEKAKTILCAIISASGGRFEGKVRLNKAFWRAHVVHYHRNDGLLSQYPIARLPEGPGADDLDDLLADLEREGRVTVTAKSSGKYVETVVTATSKPPRLDDDEQAAIDEAAKWVKGKTARSVTHEAHKLSWGWKHAANGDIMDVQFDGLDDADAAALAKEAGQIRKSVDRARGDVEAAFGE